MDSERQGHDAIKRAVASCRPPVIVVEMCRQFGDVLHSTLVVRHIRKTEPRASIVWAIGDRYVSAFNPFVGSEIGPHAVACLPELPTYPKDGATRVAWVERAAQLPGVIRAFGCGVHPWGWKRGTIVDGILDNAGISNLEVPRRPCLPVTVEDVEWSKRYLADFGLKSFVALEYVSYSLKTHPLRWFEDLVKLLPVKVVALAGASDPQLSGAIDGRGIGFRHTKALIAQASCFVGVGSGLSVLAACEGCDQPVVELTPPQLSMAGIGYRQSNEDPVVIGGRGSVTIVKKGHKPKSTYRNLHLGSVQEVVTAIKEVM